MIFLLENNDKPGPGGDVSQSKNFNDSGDMSQKRKRLESTSLSRTPIDDTALQDFHQHRLKNDDNIFDLKYNLYAIVVRSYCFVVLIDIFLTIVLHPTLFG